MLICEPRKLQPLHLQLQYFQQSPIQWHPLQYESQVLVISVPYFQFFPPFLSHTSWDFLIDQFVEFNGLRVLGLVHQKLLIKLFSFDIVGHLVMSESEIIKTFSSSFWRLLVYFYVRIKWWEGQSSQAKHLEKVSPPTCEESDTFFNVNTSLAFDQSPCVVELSLYGCILSFSHVLLASTLEELRRQC